MKKKLKYTLLALLVIVIIIQLIPIRPPENKDDLTNDLIATQNVPTEVSNILLQSCYDCHSMQTVYPWYSYVAPVSWLVVRDVKKGREEMNLSEWNSLSKRKQLRSLNNIAEEVEKKEMPMKIYTAIHRNAMLDDDEIKLIVKWANSTAEAMLNGSEEVPSTQSTEAPIDQDSTEVSDQ